MRSPNLATILVLLDVGGPANDKLHHRSLQFVLPDYTSPPLPDAVAATPPPFQSDETVDNARDLDAAGLCVGPDANYTACQIVFTPELDGGASNSSTEALTTGGKVGIIFFGGALVDPRGYSPMMRMLSDDYRIPVVVPIFTADMSFKMGVCDSGRLAQAQKAFPCVERWVLAGHSFGGIAAYNDAWSMAQQKDGTDIKGTIGDTIGGVAMIASYVRQDLGCGFSDFSSIGWEWLPFASISASEDMILNVTNYEAGQELLPYSPLVITKEIEGGNHGGFGSYDYSERETLLFQIDGNATITPEEQQSITAEIISRIASLAAEDIKMEPGSSPPSPTNDELGTKAPSKQPTTADQVFPASTSPTYKPTELDTSGAIHKSLVSSFFIAGSALTCFLCY
uniref:Alpha/beta hydrolase fold-5 domain-containing protein n=1 Tax=Proboscia inermis TaxID=420281 RepID=A0A7S0CE58_9STRA